MRNFLKYLAIITLVIISIVACESDFEDIGVGLVDNNTFDTDKINFEVLGYTKNVEKSRVDNLSVNSLGVYNNTNFGITRAGIATQMSLPTGGVDFGLEPTIDAIVLDIPYDATRDGSETDGKPKFNLNNIYGNQGVEFNLVVSQLNTFLNSLDPEDPTKPKKYYSDRTYNKLSELFAGAFKPNAKDTVLYVRRVEFDFLDDDNVMVDDYDTIKKSDLAPSIKLPLDHDFFRTNFVENTNEDDFDSQEKFVQFFNGLLFESEGDDGSVMLLNFVGTTLNIYYTNDVLTDETDTDLNNDGDTDDTDVPVRTKQTMSFGFNGVRTNPFSKVYSGSPAENALDNINENKKLYIQGAQGSLVSLDAFNNVDLATIRAENWLINEANIVFYIDQDVSGDVVPPRLFLYKLDDNDDETNDNTQILDILTEGEAIYDGNLQKDDDDGNDDTTESPLKYRFRITDYLSEVLKKEDATEPVKFGIKAFHATDLPNEQNPDDIIVRDFSWDPRGVVLYGNDYLESDPDYDKRLKLEIFYTKLNN